MSSYFQLQSHDPDTPDVDEAVKQFGLKPRNGCVTEKLRLVGSEGWSPNMFIGLIQRVSEVQNTA